MKEFEEALKDLVNALRKLLLMVGLFILVTFLIKWLWNDIVVELFQVSTITFWGAFKLNLLVKLLVGLREGVMNIKFKIFK